MAAGDEYAAPGPGLVVACYEFVYVWEYGSVRLNMPVCICVFWAVYMGPACPVPSWPLISLSSC